MKHIKYCRFDEYTYEWVLQDTTLEYPVWSAVPLLVEDDQVNCQ